MEPTSGTLALFASGLGAVGSLVGGFGQAAASRRDAAIADQNATIAEQQATARQDMIRREAAKLRGLRPPEPYKGYGIRYRGEKVRRKAGKTGKTK